MNKKAVFSFGCLIILISIMTIVCGGKEEAPASPFSPTPVPTEINFHVQGTITNKETGEPMEYIQVWISWGGTFRNKSENASTDKEGYYYIEHEVVCDATTCVWVEYWINLEPYYVSKCAGGEGGLICTDELQTIDFQLDPNP